MSLKRNADISNSYREILFDDESLDEITDKLINLIKNINRADIFFLEDNIFYDFLGTITDYQYLINLFQEIDFFGKFSNDSNIMLSIINTISKTLLLINENKLRLFNYLKWNYDKIHINNVKECILDLLLEIYEDELDNDENGRNFQEIDFILVKMYNLQNNIWDLSKIILSKLIFEYPLKDYKEKDYFKNQFGDNDYELLISILNKWKDLSVAKKELYLDFQSYFV